MWYVYQKRRCISHSFFKASLKLCGREFLRYYAVKDESGLWKAGVIELLIPGDGDLSIGSFRAVSPSMISVLKPSVLTIKFLTGLLSFKLLLGEAVA